jgi:NodT family efflux transporter outer membrane factor (OMF) lipoprotein
VRWNENPKVTTDPTKFLRLLLLLALLVCSGCQGLKVSAPVEPRLNPAPERWTARPAAAEEESAAWLDSLVDPQLKQLIAEGLSQNFSLQTAAARIRAARARARLAGADRLPTADLTFSAARRRTFGADTGATENNFSLNGLLSWEVDLWNRLGHAEQAVLQDLAAAVADDQAARLSLAASIARGWFRLTEAALQLQLANQTENSYGHSLQVIEEQYRSGLTSALDLRLARSSLSDARAGRAERERLADLARRDLELLLGRYPAGRIGAAESLPNLKGQVPAGLPSTLLDRRPDLRAAARRWQAADQRLAAARQNRLPVFQLTTAAGTASDKLYQLLDWDHLLWSLAGSLTQALLDGGRRTAEQDLARAQMEQQLTEYGAAALVAFGEVEAALAAEESLRQQEQELQLSAEEALQAQILAEQRYRQGLEGIITLLETQRRAFNARIGLLRASRLRLENRIDLHLALGGAFAGPAGPPEPMERL